MAEEAPAAELFAKVAEEAASVLGRADRLPRSSGTSPTTRRRWWRCGASSPRPASAWTRRLPVDGSGVTARVFRERRPVRVDDYTAADGAIADHAREHGIRSAVGCPILVQGRLWGAMVVAHYEAEPFPADTERRVSQFTELVATAIANAEARAQLRSLADEQAALRRVATLVAEAAAPTEVFDAVIGEVGQLLGAAQVGMIRFESADEVTIVAQRGQDPAIVRVGMRLPLDGRQRHVPRPADRTLGADRSSTRRATACIAEIVRRTNVDASRSARRSPSRAGLWGVIAASWRRDRMPPADAEERLAEFAKLLDTAIANADSRDQLTASRARVLTAGDDARRRVVRDLHDGAQQRLVHTIVTLKLAQRALGDRRRAGGVARSPRRSITPSRATPSCASWPTGSSRRS